MPNLPIARSHPVGFVNPVVMRASAVLLDAGAWDVAPIETFCAGAEGVTAGVGA